ncbi:MAG: NADH:ubiquinone reductase (Na(+)-transporting) subunit E [Bacteroidales bacterium]|uniref:NADH:ubiquinone reductase (Na(+)-transporting) subunit E n=1 Tax=Porphyromonas sp. TaxID=1924944 RepID=UPI002972BF98|nr:NADH:ubiquinone reductase (Na(+)-transporting) subunit E [Porphyromonas sp.]MDD7438818.1 NADH:ubiquinone reductase (Na(+)-transporting) subunit E [Bacteroidales bacterium]MDY3066865.1 NADH:ubiquinone reductase (Na(+)-transporting) subunit E [Porphyromonas sp.]
MEYLSLFVKSIFVDNMIFAYFLGMCSYLAISKNVKTSVGLGIAVVVVQVLTLPLNYLLWTKVLQEGALAWTGVEALAGLDLSYLSLLIFIAVIAAFVQMLEMAIEKFSPALYNSLGIFLPLIAVNCAILGGSLFMQQKVGGDITNFGHALSYAAGSGFGWMLAIVGLAAIREKMIYNDVPKPLRGFGMALIITALMGIAFQCFSGLSI